MNDCFSRPDPFRARLREIADLNVLARDGDRTLARITEEAALSTGLPLAWVSVVLNEAECFLASYGLRGWLQEARGIPIEWSFSAYAVVTGEPLIAADTTEHPWLLDKPLVSIDSLRAYAGFPLVSAHGHVLGALCVAGDAPHAFSPQDLDALRALTMQALVCLDARCASHEIALCEAA